ncbi:c-type cytochrome [Frigidibacter albus]|uniref:C-type cytochrome n=1 Tax=Frigidibacter albus TaxID=1465486 RepID=A0A6L8VEX3_9RHOB|nr:di-heme oxidoredictase family protein [Frigidibacter albus]MZQ88714.1 c-type cytochrome [Frigidibacter albus]NBE30477.1 c-type cytochrome [Frigidibacter albus]
MAALLATPAQALDMAARSAAEAARVAAVLAPPAGFSAPEPFEALPGGSGTSRGEAARGRAAFAAPLPGMGAERELDFHMGAALFGKLWVAAPSSTRASDGVGPLFNARSCLGCHPGNGRGQPRGPEDPGASGMVLRLSVAGEVPAELAAIEGYLATLPHPELGEQLQDFAVAGLTPEGQLAIRYTEIPVALAGGETASLRQPLYSVAPALPPGTLTSPRIAPPMIGLGLLEAIPEADILAAADPDDADGDGISGRANTVWSRAIGAPALGRFGWKAGHATLADQVASAFAIDIGISNPLYPGGWGDCTSSQTGCREARHGEEAGLREGLELDSTGLALTTHFAAAVAVPERRGIDDRQVLRGKEIFHSAGCAACHRPKHVTARLTDAPRSFQLIWPYTDLLLHDMGEGLADHRPEATATGAEWRTPPLWGIGLTQAVSGHTLHLHDGRARNLLEAILWHGGEAEPARDRVADMPPGDRAALIRFLESL